MLIKLYLLLYLSFIYIVLLLSHQIYLMFYVLIIWMSKNKRILILEMNCLSWKGKLRMYAWLIVQLYQLFFKIKKNFLELKFLERKVSIILDLVGLIESFGRAIILLANRTTLCIPNALYSSKIQKKSVEFLRYLQKWISH